jgi:glyoxylase-like metal-dependent hydrolase (beta-lactamase superfamily II)
VVCHPKERPIIEDPTMATRTEYLESIGGDPAQVAADLTLDGPEDVTFDDETFAEHWNYPIEVDDTVEDGDVLQVGELAVEVLHTPGHTPGHLSLYTPSSGGLYLTDVMYWPTPIPSGRWTSSSRASSGVSTSTRTTCSPGTGSPGVDSTTSRTI